MKNIAIILFLLTTLTVSARNVISLNRSWNFTPGYEVRKNVYTEVNLPHTWNLDALSGKEDYFRGLGNYEKSINIPAEWQGKTVYLRFKGVNSVANVFVNGRHAGEHRGGYTAFTFDISSYLNYGKQNKLWVRVNNALQLDVMPLVGDFNMYGGIYRDVDLIVAEPNHIALTDYASSGVYLTQKNVSKELAVLEAKVLLTSKQNGQAILKIQIKDNRQQIIAEQQQSLTLSGEKLQPALFTFNIEKPHLWQGTEDPYLYSVETKLIMGNDLIDEVTERIGFRSYTVDSDKGLFLNGKHVQLRGVCRHQDREGLGNALYPLHHQEDLDIIREMGANALRLSHYPHDRYIYDLCDEYGIILWSEIPFVGPGGYRDGGFVDQFSFRENGKQQLLEMLHQNYNHSSILFWGLFNELKTDGDNPAEYLKELKAIVAETDPSRLTVAASFNETELNRIPELIAWNQYFGWYGGRPAAIGAWADRAHREYSGIPVGISEYGAGASIYHQQEELKKPEANSYWHPENWQAYFHEEHWRAISQRPYLWGTFIWAMFDFGAAHRTEGEIKGKNDKGLVTFDRKVRKDAFYFYKANWNTADPFVYIAEKRMNKRTKQLQTIKVYSNQAEVELFANGKSLGKRRGEYGIFLWENVLLNAGDNLLKAAANTTITDSVQISLSTVPVIANEVKQSMPLSAYTGRDLLQKAANPETVKQVMITGQKWVPYPAYSDRSGWNVFLGENKAGFIRNGEKQLQYEWKVVKATDYIEFERSGNRRVMQDPFNSNIQAIVDLLMAELAEGKSRFTDQLINGIFSVCEMSSWAESAHLGKEQVSHHSLPDNQKQVIDLISGDLSSLLAWTYYFLHSEFDKVNPVISQRLYSELKRRILDPFLNDHTFWWTAFDYRPGMMVNNWNPWCNFNVLQSFFLLENDEDRLAKGIYDSMVSTDKFINYVHSDGACEEGPSYWGHAAGKLYDYLQMLYDGTGGKINLFNEPIIRNMGEYIVRSYVGGNWVVNFADASAKGGGDAPLIFRYGKAVSSPLMTQYAAYLKKQSGEDNMRASRDIFRTFQTLKYQKEIENETPAFRLPGYTWYPETEFCYMSNAQGLFLATKGGFNNESHNHNDVGTFSLYVNQTPIFIDAGVGTYTRQTFSNERYSIWTMQSLYHNLPEINGKAQQHGAQFKAKDTRFDSKQNRFSLDIADAYPADAEVKTWKRTYTLNKSTVSINDEFALTKADTPNKLHFLTWGKVDISRAGEIFIEVNGQKVCLEYDKNTFTPSIETIPLNDARLSNVWGTEIYRLTLRATRTELSGTYKYKINTVK